MFPVDVNGISVDFPYQPYDCQIKYMEKVIECLENKKNGVLESPTGTGKTLCLLCACLGWLEKEKENLRQQISGGSLSLHMTPEAKQIMMESLAFSLPKIIYTSRTHSQLSQVIRELNKTIYKTKIKVCIFGSRDHLCINETVQKEENSFVKSSLCRAKVQSRTCPFYWGIDDRGQSRNNPAINSAQVPDIEEFITLGRKHRFCPFYKARDNQDEADLILMPYNYILDPRARKANKIELRGNIVIFDEAHNLEKVCEESASVSFSSRDLAGCLKECKETLTHLIAEEEELRTSMEETTVAFGKSKTLNETSQTSLDTKQLAHLLVLLDSLEKQFDCINFDKLTDDKTADSNFSQLPGKILPGSFLFEILDKSGIVPQMRDSIIMLLDQMSTYLAQKLTNGVWHSKGIYLQKLNTFLSTVFAKDSFDQSRSGMKSYEKHSKMFKVFLQKDEPKKEFGQQKLTKIVKTNQGIVLNYWCFSAGLSMTTLTEKGVRSILVTSGTLSPLQHFVNEIKIQVDVTLENDHVIDKNQVSFNVICKGPDQQPLLATYNNRSNAKYLNSLSNSLMNLFRIVPEGILVFFASYSQMESCLEFWKVHKIPRSPADVSASVVCCNWSCVEFDAPEELVMFITLEKL